MKRTDVFLLCLVLAGCVPTADFRDLRDDVRQLQAENRKLREEILKHQAEQDRALRPDELAKRLEALDAKIDSLRIKQQGVEQKLGELLRQTEESARQAETPLVRADEGAKIKGHDVARDSRSEAAPAVPPKAGAPDTTSVLTPTTAYNQAYNDYLKGYYDLAIAGFEDFLRKFPGTSLSAHAQYWIGEAYFNKKEYRQAIDAAEQVIVGYPKSDKVPAALFRIGVSHVELGEIAKAKERLKAVIEKFPQTNEAGRARLKLAELK